MSSTFKTLILLALPASGKSEVRKFLDWLLKQMGPEGFADTFHLEPTVQLDDYPYVHAMRQIDEALVTLGAPRIFYPAPDLPFYDPRTWSALIYLLNMDYKELLVEGIVRTPYHAATDLLRRIGAARSSAGLPLMFGESDSALISKLCDAMEYEARKVVEMREKVFAKCQGRSLVYKTLVIEFARGGPQGASMPLRPPLGYAHALSLLHPRILEGAAILYVWVTPEQARKRNLERADPNDPGSILRHCVPEEVMLKDYGCDDIEHLLTQSGKPNTIRLEVRGRIYEIPTVRFDNRTDLTSFVRRPEASWTDGEVRALRVGLEKSFGILSRTQTPTS